VGIIVIPCNNTHCMAAFLKSKMIPFQPFAFPDIRTCSGRAVRQSQVKHDKTCQVKNLALLSISLFPQFQSMSFESS
jgi:hypothetical protein